jgi:hypothetical protein
MQTSELVVNSITDSTILPELPEPLFKSQSEKKEGFSSDTSDEETILSGKDNIIFFDKSKKSSLREHELQWWLGRVTEIHENYFSAILEDLNGVTSLVDLDSEVVPQHEKDLLFVDSIFTYTVSVVDNLFGGREYRTKIAFNSKRTWVEEYERKTEELLEQIFPERLLNL